MKLLSVLRKGLASVTLAALALSIVPFNVSAASVSDFTDANQIPSWADEAISELMDQGVLSGNGDGSFAPNRQLNRAEVAKIIVLATGIDMDTTGGNAFPDVNAGDWFYDYVMTMYNYGWINGYPDGYFRPGVGINRAEIAKMLVAAFELDIDTTGGAHFSDVPADSWMYSYVETVFNNGIMTGFANGQFGPDRAVTRAEVARMTYDTQLVVAGPVGPAEGTLEVMLSNDTPRGTNIPYNATSVPFTTLELTAADDSDVEIRSLTVTRLGLGDNDDFDNVWLEIDGFKVGNSRAINNDDYAELRFNPPIVVPAGQTLVADVVGSLEGNASSVGQNNRLAVVSAADVVSSAINVVGDFPIEGEEMEIASYEVSQIEFDALGSDTTVNVGDAFVEVGKFKLLNATTTNKDIELRAITFKNDGTAQLSDVLENVVLYVSGEQVSAETILDGDYVTFRLDNGVTGGYIIEDGDSRIFSIRTDIVAAEDGDIINFKVDNFEDIVGIEIGTAFGVKAISGETGATTFTSDSTTFVATTSCVDQAAEDNCARLSAYTIDSGDINISRDPASLGNQEYAPGSNDVVFMTARLVVDQPITLDGMKVRVATGSSVLATANPVTTADTVAAFEASFDNFRLYLNDQLIDSKNELTASTTLVGSYFNFDTQFEVAGTSILKLVGNIKDGATTGSQLKFKVSAATDLDSPEYIASGDQVVADQLLGSAESSFVSVEVSELKVTRTDGFGTETLVAGVKDVSVMKFVLDNNDSGDVNVTSISVKGTGTGNGAIYSNFQLAMFVDGVQQGSSRNLSTAGTATFNDLSVNITSAGQKEFTLVADTIESSADGNPGETTVATPATGSTTTVQTGCAVGGGDCVFNTTATFYSKGVNSVMVNANLSTVIAPDDTVQLYLDGDAIVDGTGTSYDGDETQVQTFVVGNVTYDGTNTTIEFTTSTTDPYTEVTSIGLAKVQTQYDATVTAGTDFVFTVTDTTDFAVNDIVGVNAITPVVFTDATRLIVTAVNAAAKTITAKPYGATLTPVVPYTFPTVVTSNMYFQEDPSTTSSVYFTVTDIEADNVENGQSVVVKNNTTEIDPIAATGALQGATFTLVASGELQISVGSVIDSDVLVAGQTDISLVNILLEADYDDVEVTDLFLVNNFADASGRFEFKLYDETGKFLQTKQMTTGDKLHFELGNTNRIIVPKDGSTFVTVKATVRPITNELQTGKQLQLKNDPSAVNAGTTITVGAEAVTAATGTNLPEASITNSYTGREFVAYATKVSLDHAATQPLLASGSPSSIEYYRFVVSADSAGAVDIYKATFDIDLGGLQFDVASGGAGTAPTADKFTLKRLKDNGTPDTTVVLNTGIGTDGVVVVASTETSATVSFYLDIDETLSAGTSKTYGIFMEGVYDADGDSQGDTVSVTPALDDTYQAATTAALADAASSFVWSDKSASPHNATSGDWLNSYLLDFNNNAKVIND